MNKQKDSKEAVSKPELYTVLGNVISNDESDEDFDLEDCPNCGSGAVGYDGTDGFFECFQCDHNWIG
jgi:hypothetical protein